MLLFCFGGIRGGHHEYIIWQFGIIHNGILYLKVMPRAIYTKDHNVIVKRLKQARLESGLGQVEASKKLGKTQSYLSKNRIRSKTI